MEDFEKIKRFERRRLKLQELINKETRGNHAAFARKIGKAPSYISRLLYEEGKEGKKRIGDDLMISIESTCNLPRGWFDADDNNDLDWPFVITRKQYKTLSPQQKEEINRYMTFIYQSSAQAK